MDATQQFAEKLGCPVPKTFVIAGASKVSCYSIIFLVTIIYYLLKFSVDGQVSCF